MYDPILVKEAAPSLLDLANPLTILKRVSTANGGEYSGGCPFCGGVDRFSVQPHADDGGRWLCRNCTDGKYRDVIDFIQRRDNSGFVEACRYLFGDDVQVAIDPAEYARLQEQRDQSIQAQIQQEQAKQQVRREQLETNRSWEPYYQILQRDETGRKLWNERGLSDLWIDYYKVGYCPSRKFYSPHEFESPTLTIPTWQGKRCVGLSHRLLMDNPPGGKYRPHLAGTGKSLYFGDVHTSEIIGDVLILEGEIKTMVTFANVWKDDPLIGHQLFTTNIVGVAGKGFKHEYVAQFDQAETIYICLDPDATAAADKVATMLGRERCKVVELPEKIDDLFLVDAINIDKLWKYMQRGRRISEN